MSRLFAIPDIHGRKDLLDELLETLKNKHNLQLETDKLIFLGDMVDRGPDSKGVMDTIRGYQDVWGTDRVIALAGNHEWLMIDGIAHDDYDRFYLWMVNGGGTTLKSFPGEKVPKDYLMWAAALPLYHEEPGFFFSHAPISKWTANPPPGMPWPKQALIWTYEDGDEELWSHHHADGVVGVCGHIHQLRTGRTEPRLYDHYIFADAGAGCAPWGALVAIEVRSREVIYARPKVSPPQVTNA